MASRFFEFGEPLLTFTVFLTHHCIHWLLPPLMQLLMVPTPFIVGVCTSFMKKVNEVHRSETWVVDLDKKEVYICTRCHGDTGVLAVGASIHA